MSHRLCTTIDRSKFIRTTKITNQLAQSHKLLDILHDYINFNVDGSLIPNLSTYISSINLNILSRVIVVTRFKTNIITHETQNTSLLERVTLYNVYQKVWTILRSEFPIPKEGNSVFEAQPPRS